MSFGQLHLFSIITAVGLEKVANNQYVCAGECVYCGQTCVCVSAHYKVNKLYDLWRVQRHSIFHRELRSVVSLTQPPTAWKWQIMGMVAAQPPVWEWNHLFFLFLICQKDVSQHKERFSLVTFLLHLQAAPFLSSSSISGPGVRCSASLSLSLFLSLPLSHCDGFSVNRFPIHTISL